MQYALRCLEPDYPTLLQLWKILWVITEESGQIVPATVWAWDYIGYIPDETTWTLETIDGVEVRIWQTPKWVGGVPYIHVNILTEINIRERAEALAVENPEIAWALSVIPKFFITDADWNATLPNNPYRVFA